jgi:hypothetical protein
MRHAPLTLFLAALLVPSAGLAAPPDACAIVKVEEINAVAAGSVEKVQPRKAGNPSECGFLDARRGAVLVVSIREVQYAVRDEYHHERETLEKIYKSKSKKIETVGDEALWLAPNNLLMFRKGKRIVTVTFSRAKNQNEVDTAQVARLVESRLD